jgi:hypothetical protein
VGHQKAVNLYLQERFGTLPFLTSPAKVPEKKGILDVGSTSHKNVVIHHGLLAE